MEYKTQTTYGKVRKGRQNGRPRPYNKQRPKNGSDSRITGRVGSTGFSIPSMPLFGYRIRKTLPYFATGNVTSGASTAGAYVLSLNGLFDPDITGTGGQPMSFDQLMTFFNHYTVHNATFKVVMKSNSSALRVTVGAFVSGSSSAITSIEQLVENGDGAFQELEYSGAFGGSATFTGKIDAGRFQTVHDVMDDPNMRGDAASNPTEQAYIHLVVWNSSSATAVSADFQLLLQYDTTFHEPRKGTLS